MSRLQAPFAGSAGERSRTGIVERLVTVGAFGLALLYSLRRMSDTDLWGHLACGEYLFRNGKILTTYFFNCSWPDFPYVNHSWLFQAVIYAVNVLAGERGLMALQVFLVLLAFYLLFRILRSRTDSLPMIAAVLSLGVLAASHRFALRPQHFTYVFLLYFLLSLDAYRRGYSRPALFLPLVMLVWVNTHAESLWGLIILGVFLTTECLHRWRQGGEERRKGKQILLISALVLAASFVNPFTWKTVFWPLFVMKEQFAGVEEILPPVEVRFLFFWIYFALVVLSTVLNVRRADPFWLVLSALFAVAAWTANRGIPHFVFVSAPLLTGNIADLRRQCGDRISIPRAAATGGTAVLLAGTLALMALVVTNPRYLQKYDGIPYPEKALAFLRSREITGNVINDHIWGSFIIWNSWPGLKPYIDGRFFHKQFYDEYYPLMAGRPGWEQVLDKYGITIAVLAYSPDRNPRLNDRLFVHPRWRLVYWDDAALVYLKDSETNRRALELSANDLLNPDRDLFPELDGKSPVVIRRLSEIAERNLRSAGDSAKALVVAANSLLALGEYGRARERFEAALAHLDPPDPRVYYQIALCYRAEGDLAMTEQYLMRSLELVPDSRTVADLLQQVRLARRAREAAVPASP